MIVLCINVYTKHNHDLSVFCQQAKLLALKRGHCICQMARKKTVGQSPASDEKKCTFEDG